MQATFDGGWIYIMMTSADYERFKVGRTKGNPLSRAKHLRTGDPGLDLEAAYHVPASLGSLSRVEASLHDEFGERIAFHDEAISEWFKGSAKQACSWIEAVFEEWQGAPVASMHMLGCGRVCRAYEEDLQSFYGPCPLSPVDGLPM